ncbi:ABC transporter permease [soil metagenome]
MAASSAPRSDTCAAVILRPGWRPLMTTLGPLVLANVAAGILIAFAGRDPIAFYGDIFEAGLLNWNGFQESVNRMAPLLFIAAGLIVAFRANVWNLGIDAQFLLGAVMVAGLGPLMAGWMPSLVMAIVTITVAALVGAAWTLLPAWLKVRHEVNEIITTVMTSFIGISLARFLVKYPFRDPDSVIDQTRVITLADRLPTLPGSRIHIGIVLGLVAILGVHFVVTRTSLGSRLDVVGFNRRAARHAGLSVSRVIIVAFAISGALIGIGGAVSIVGDWGSARSDWNPAWGFLVVPLIFLGRRHGVATAVFVAMFAVVSIGSQVAARRQELPLDFTYIVTGLILLFLTITEYLETRRERDRVDA